MAPDAPVLIGVDGGGSSCRAVLTFGTGGGRVGNLAENLPGARPGHIRHEVTLGPANVSTDFDAALATINRALAMLAERASLSPDRLAGAHAHLGLAGVMSEAIAARVAAQLPLRHATVTDDRPTTIAGALGEVNGAVAAIGTGSFIGRQADGVVRGVGGWGFYIGDQASGAWLLRRCLEEVMLAVDGFSALTGLGREILRDHGDDPGQIVLFSLTAQPADFARLARDVVAAADAGDALGHRLMTEGASYIRAALGVLGWQPGEAVCLTGGLGPAYADRLGLPTVPPAGTALDGALTLAARGAARVQGGPAAAGGMAT